MIRRLLVAAVVLVVAAGAFGYFYRPAAGGTVAVEIVPGSTTTAIAEQLRNSDVIGSTLAFRLMARVRRVDGRIEAGRYEMRRGMGVQAALDVLSRSPAEKGVGITVPEGFTIRQVAARVGARTRIPAAQFLTAVTNGSVRAGIQPPNVRTLEGFLFPETYFVGDSETAVQVAQRMLRQFESKTSDLDWSVPESRGLSRYQALVVASLVEREAKVPEDRAKVAAVIYNRLAKRMRLQIDASAIYDLPTHKVPTRADLARRSPYNTYIIPGLPPTPIANPGLAAVDAALHPAQTDDLYFVVCEPSGKHCFTNSPREFERLKQRRPAEVH